MKSYKVFMIIVSALVVVNCVLLGIFWFKKGPRPLKNGLPPAANVYLTKELNLTLAQERLYDTMRMQHFAITHRLNEQSHKLKDEFFENIKSPVLDTNKTFAIEHKLAALQMTLDTVTLNHFRKFRNILSPNQQQKFDRIIQNALRMMGQQRPRPNEHGTNGIPPPPDNLGPPPGQEPPPDGQRPPPVN